MNQFVEDSSAELRPPLADNRTNIEVAEMDPEISQEEYRTLLDTVKAQTARLTRLREALLLLSSSEGEALELDPVALFDVADEVASQLGPVAATHSMALRAEGDETVEAMAGTDQLYRCVFNLVDNAIKYAG